MLEDKNLLPSLTLAVRFFQLVPVFKEKPLPFKLRIAYKPYFGLDSAFTGRGTQIFMELSRFLSHVNLTFRDDFSVFLAAIFQKIFEVICLCRVQRSFVQDNGVFSEISIEFRIFQKEA